MRGKGRQLCQVRGGSCARQGETVVPGKGRQLCQVRGGSCAR